jgi:hypothetical protein
MLISVISIIGIITLNYNLAKLYIAASPKSKALFGIQELSRLSYKIELFIAGLVAFILSVIAFRKNENKTICRFSLFVSLIAMILVFIRFWRWMI